MFSNKNKILIIILWMTCLTTLGLDIAITVLVIKFPNVSEDIAIKSEVISVFTISAGGTPSPSIGTAYCLRFMLCCHS